MANDGAQENKTPVVADVQALLNDFDQGKIEFNQLPQEVQDSILSGDVVETSDEPAPPPAEGLKAEPEAPPAVPTATEKPKPAKGSWEERQMLFDEANKWKQKALARERLLDRLTTDRDFAIEHLKKKGMSLIQGEDPRTTARIAEITESASAHSAPSTLTEDPTVVINRVLDQEIMEATDVLGETFSQADQKWVQVWQALGNDPEKVQRYQTDPEFRKTVNVPEIKNLDAYLEVSQLTQLWQSGPRSVPLSSFLALYGHKKAVAPQAPATNVQRPPVATPETRRADEVPILSVGQKGPAEEPGSVERLDRLLHAAEYQPHTLTPDDKAFIFRMTGIS